MDIVTDDEQAPLHDVTIFQPSPDSFRLIFRSDDIGHSILIVDALLLSKRWPFFANMLSASTCEFVNKEADLAEYLSIRAGRVLVEYLLGITTDTTALTHQDCRDLIEHCDFFGIACDSRLIRYCNVKLIMETSRVY